MPRRCAVRTRMPRRPIVASRLCHLRAPHDPDGKLSRGALPGRPHAASGQCERLAALPAGHGDIGRADGADCHSRRARWAHEGSLFADRHDAHRQPRGFCSGWRQCRRLGRRASFGGFKCDGALLPSLVTKLAPAGAKVRRPAFTRAPNSGDLLRWRWRRLGIGGWRRSGPVRLYLGHRLGVASARSDDAPATAVSQPNRAFERGRLAGAQQVWRVDRNGT